jgi:hypothetical protein
MVNTTTVAHRIQPNRSPPACWPITFDDPPLDVVGPQFVGEFAAVMVEVERDQQLKDSAIESAVGAVPAQRRPPPIRSDLRLGFGNESIPSPGESSVQIHPAQRHSVKAVPPSPAISPFGRDCSRADLIRILSYRRQRGFRRAAHAAEALRGRNRL